MCGVKQKADSGPAKLIGDSLRSHQENLFTNPRQAFDMFLTGKFAYIQVLYLLKIQKVD